MEIEKEDLSKSEAVPVFKNWKGWYLFLIGLLIVEVVFFYLLTFGFNE